MKNLHCQFICLFIMSGFSGARETFFAETDLLTIDTAVPEVTVISPNGGESFAFNSSISAAWWAEDDTLGTAPISLGISTTEGGACQLVVSDLENSGEAAIIPPQIATDEAMLCVIAVDNFGNTGMDSSDNYFSIGQFYPDIIIPNEESVLPAAPGQGHQYNITWSTDNPPEGLDHLSIDYSLDSGSSFPYAIAANVPDEGQFYWTVPNISTSTCRLKISAWDSADVLLSTGTNSADFSIDNMPPGGAISLSGPTNGDWTDGTPLFSWSQSGLTDVVNLAVVADNVYLTANLSSWTTYYQTPVEMALSSGWHTWTVRGLDQAGNWVQASQYWSFQVDATPPAIFFLLQPENDVWRSNATPTFIWSPSMDNGTGLAEYAVYLNDNLVMDGLNPQLNQWSAITGSQADDFEFGLSNWNTQGSWGLSASSQHSGEYSVTDSPGGNYGNNQNSAITLAQAVNLNGATSLQLTYWYHCDFSYSYTRYDHLYVEISSNGNNWNQIADYDTDQWSWTQASHNLNGYLGWSQIIVRFRLLTNGSGTADGYYLDDFALVGSGLELPDGDYDWYITALDAVGNAQQSADIFTLNIDTTPPHGLGGSFINLNPADNLWTADSLQTFSWQPCIDDGIGLEYYSLWIDAVNYSGELSGMEYTLSDDQILENGTHNWGVTVTDTLGNATSTSHYTLNIDRLPPAQFSLEAPLDGAFFNMPTPEFSWHATTDAGSGLSHYELWIDDLLSVDNLTALSSSPGMPIMEGYHQWYIMAEDNVGNRIQSSDIWTAVGDWSPPTQPWIVYPTLNEMVYLSQPELIWLKSTDAGSGLSHYDLILDNNLVLANFVPEDLNADTVSVQCPLVLANGSHTWYVRAFDLAGGENSSIYGFFIVDVDITAPMSEITDPVFDQYIGGESYLVSGQAEDNTGGVGVDMVEISFDGGNTWHATAPVVNMVQTSAGTYPVLDLPQLGERTIYFWEFIWLGYETGSYNIMTRAIDFNGNTEFPPNTLQINVEIIPPEIESMTISPNPISTGTVQFTIQFLTGEHCGGMNNSATPIVTFTPLGGEDYPVTQTNFQGNTWHGQTTIAGTEINGEAFVQVSEAQDNISNTMLLDDTHSFLIDTEPPMNFDLISPADGTWTNIAEPTFTWGAASDLTTGISHYSLEIDGSTGPPGLEYLPSILTETQPSAPLTLGTHTWRVRAADEAGNQTWSSSSFMIGFDLTDPVSSITSPVDGSTIAGLSYTITGTAFDGGGVGVSGVDFVEIRIYYEGYWTGWIPVINTGVEFDSWSYEWNDLESGEHIIQCRATDRAGNMEVPQLQVIVYVDMLPPEVAEVDFVPDPVTVGAITCSIQFLVNISGLNYAIHPEVIFITPSSIPYVFEETAYAGNVWDGVAEIPQYIENGLATLQVFGATDNLGNVMEPNYAAGYFLVDTADPTVADVSVDPSITNIRNDLIVEIYFADAGSGMDVSIQPDVRIIPNGMPIVDYIPVFPTGYNVDTGLWTGIAEITEQAAEGAADIRVMLAQDLAGNELSTTELEDQFIIDYSAPIAFSILFPTDSLWISERQPIIYWTPSADVISGLAEYRLFINDEQLGSGIAPTETTVQLESPLADGSYRIQIAAVDHSEEPNLQYSDGGSIFFTVDGTPPISEITFPLPGHDMQTCSLQVAGTAHDGIGVYAGIGVHKVLLSPDGGEYWDTVLVTQEPHLETVNWQYEYCLSPGPHTIVTRSADWLGNLELAGASVSVVSPQPGDINDDGVINVLDILLIVGIILDTHDPTDFELWAANVNGDEVIDILDIITIVTMILDDSLSRGTPVKAAHLQLNNNTLHLDTDGKVAGLQLHVKGDFEINTDYLPEGWQLFRSENTILIFSLDGSVLTTEDLFQYTGDLNVESVTVTDWYCNLTQTELLMIPVTFALHPLYPNPFNPVTIISYELPSVSDVSVSVYNLTGQEVAVLVHERRSQGVYNIQWDGHNHPSGIYFIQMIAVMKDGQVFKGMVKGILLR